MPEESSVTCPEISLDALGVDPPVVPGHLAVTAKYYLSVPTLPPAQVPRDALIPYVGQFRRCFSIVARECLPMQGRFGRRNRMKDSGREGLCRPHLAPDRNYRNTHSQHSAQRAAPCSCGQHQVVGTVHFLGTVNQVCSVCLASDSLNFSTSQDLRTSMRCSSCESAGGLLGVGLRSQGRVNHARQIRIQLRLNAASFVRSEQFQGIPLGLQRQH